jgi:predicted RNA-binding Zn-ribbon protein involved in translation (DUF1610 family)
MKLNLEVLQQLYSTFEVAPITSQPAVKKAIESHAAVKAPAKYEPILVGNGYEWNDQDLAYHLGDQAIYYFDHVQMFLWIWSNVLYRTLKGGDKLVKWIQGNEQYPEGKANTFMGTYKQMTGQDNEGGGGVAVAPSGEEGNEPEQDLDRGAGGSTSINFTGTGDRGEKYVNKKVDPADVLIMQLTKKAGTKKTLPSDLMIDLGLKAKKDGNEKLLKFLSNIKPLGENVIKQSDLNRLIREITQTVAQEIKKKKKEEKPFSESDLKSELAPVTEDGGDGAAGGMTTTVNVSPVTGPRAFKKKHGASEEQIDEITTTDGGTPGYQIPGWVSRKGGSKAGVAGSAALGYTLTNVGKKDMELKGDKLYESIASIKKNLKEMMGKKEDRPICRHCQKPMVYGGQIACPNCGKAQGEVKSGEASHSKRFATKKTGLLDISPLQQEVYGLGANFDKAQQAYDAQMPPEEPGGPECPKCGGEISITDKGRRQEYWWVRGKCQKCGYKHENDNF